MKRFLCALICAIMICAVAAGAFSEEEKLYAPGFTVLDGEGNEVKLSDMLDGKPVVINLWATWCPPCVAELPHFDEAAKQYADKITFMLVNLTDGQYETIDGAKEFISDAGYTFSVYFDVNGEAASSYVEQYIPMTWFINADGTILGYVTGGMEAATLQSCIEMLLGE